MSKWSPVEKKILKGEQLYSEGKYEDALNIFEEVIEEDPQNVAALNDAGVLHFEMQNSEKSIKYLTDALRISPGNLSSILTLIDNYITDQNYDSARDTFYSYVDYINDVEVKSKYKSLLFSGNSLQSEIERGESRYLAGDIDKAKTIFQGILLVDESNTDALNNLSVIYHQNDKIQRAKEFAKRAYSLNPNDADIQENYAELFGDVSVTVPKVKTLKIAFICGPDTKFLTDIEDRFEDQYKVKRLHYTNNVDLQEIQSAMVWADITWFEWCDRILINASNNLKKSSKVICRLHGYEIFAGYPAKVNWNFIDQIIFVAKHKKVLFKELFPNVNIKNTVVRNGVSVDSFFVAPHKVNTKNLLLLGNLNYRKGLQLLIQYYRELLYNDPEFHLFIRGEWQDLRYKLYVTNIIEELQLQKKITFINEWVEDINDFMSDKSHILSFSIEESFHYAIGNGMAAGLKPVIHSWKESREIWPNEFIFNDLTSFLNIILDSQYSPALYRKYILDLCFTVNNQVSELDSEFITLMQENSSDISSLDVDSQYQDNIEYWKNRYERVGGARTVGHLNWDKKTYDEETTKIKSILEPFLNKISRDISLKNTLDFGCGIARFADLLLKHSDNYYGVDPVENVIGENNKNFSESNRHNFSPIEKGQIPFKDIKFDLIFSSFVFQHIIEDNSIKNYVEQFKSLLSDDGYLLFLENLGDQKSGGHMRYRSFTELKILFDGFKLEEVGEYRHSGKKFAILTARKTTALLSFSKFTPQQADKAVNGLSEKQESWFNLSPYSVTEFTQLDNMIATGEIFSIKCEQLDSSNNWEVELGLNKNATGMLAQYLVYDAENERIITPVKIRNKTESRIIESVKVCLNNSNITLNEQVRGFIYDQSLLNNIKENLKEYIWERIFPGTVFCTLQPFLIHMDRYRFASEHIQDSHIVVDAACGIGYGTKFLSRFSDKIFGIDISEESIRMARKYYNSENIQWKIDDVLDLSLQDNIVDIFTSMETFEHINPPEKLLSEISRVLNNEGVAFISTPNGESPRRKRVNNPYHEHEYSYDELVSICGKFFNKVELFGSTKLGQFKKVNYSKRIEYDNILVKASGPLVI
ncbi:MAG: methyltransferase domain-containing protein [Candidatus Marinimicrobia bacterium]|nr:methyltransferase domain-containing protein [Candidatus Neomarinimicrobiota bacterium]